MREQGSEVVTHEVFKGVDIAVEATPSAREDAARAADRLVSGARRTLATGERSLS